MYPHERSLVEKLEGKPFALIGINSDLDRDKIKEDHVLHYFRYNRLFLLYPDAVTLMSATP